MPWNQATQEEYKRSQQELETTLTDDEWKLIEPLLPAPAPKGRPRTTDQGRTLRVRQVFDAIQFLLATGCQWRLLPRCFPPFTTVRTDSGTGRVGSGSGADSSDYRQPVGEDVRPEESVLEWRPPWL